VLVFTSICPKQASAQSNTGAPEDGYARVIREALAEFDAGRFPEARALFEQAHGLRPSARTFRGLGVADFELRNYVRAIDELTHALADTRNPLTDEQRREAESVVERARRYTGTVQIETTPRDAQLVVDGVTVAQGELELNAGEHVLSAHSGGYKPFELKFSVEGQRAERLRVDLVPEAAGTTTPGPALATQPVEPPHAQKSLVKQWWFWTAIGVVVAGSVTAGAFALSASTKESPPIAPKTGVVVTSLRSSP
jgi:hypothetical protein